MIGKISIYSTAAALAFLFSIYPAFAREETTDLGLQVLQCDVQLEPPAWALYERQLIESLNRAGYEFYNTYVEPDGTVRFKERYEGGMNSSDDLYEAFRGFSLHTAFGGSEKIDELHRAVWEGITRQFTRYGQIYREFDSNWDWMHHGEGYVSLYPMGMVNPNDPVFRDRAVRFAAMYTGEDPESQNYDPKLKLIRSVMNGSRGPKMEWTKRDWIPTNANLVYYPLPFLDIPGVEATTAWINDHPDNDQFAKLVKAMSDRMAKGDVPINLTSTPLIANAYLYTGDSKYVKWVTDYVGAWEQRTRENNGITPDNVGLSGKTGEYTGHWWGGYYGWVWPRGGTDIVLAQLTAAKVATLLTGDNKWVGMPRSQINLMREQGKVESGKHLIPIRHDHRGWYHYVSDPAYVYLNLWFLSHEEQDWREIERLANAEIETRGRIADPDLEWAYFVKGRNEGFAERAFRKDLKTVVDKVAYIQNEHGDSESWVDSKWIGADPMVMANLTRLSVGGLPIHVRGEMLHSQVRYFDARRRRPGLPPDVSALVTRIEKDWIEVEVFNLHAAESRSLVIQGGAYGEHQFKSVGFQKLARVQTPQVENNPRHESWDQNLAQASHAIDAKAFVIELTPGAGSTIRIQLDRYANKPTYDFPWTH